jgi:hypothetical protein
MTSGTFNTAGGILLAHELNNFTMSEAIKFYPQLKSAFSVGCIRHGQKYRTTLTFSSPVFSASTLRPLGFA